MQTYSFKEFGLDLLIGFTTVAVCAMPAAILNHLVPSAGLQIALGAAIFFAISAARSRPWGKPLLHGLGIGLGASLAGLSAVAILQRSELPLYVLGSLLLVGLCVIAAFCRRLYDTSHAAVSLCVLLGTTALGVAGWFHAVPELLAVIRMKHVNRPAPAFTVTRLDGSPVTLESLHGKVVVLDFWATWCAPCQAEMPTLLKVYQHFQNDPNVVYLAVDTGWEGDSDDRVRAFVTRKRFPFPVALDHAHAADKFQITTIPTQIVIDRNGHVRLMNLGYFDNPEQLETRLTKGVESLLKK